MPSVGYKEGQVSKCNGGLKRVVSYLNCEVDLVDRTENLVDFAN